jgi:hypothetical protein
MSDRTVPFDPDAVCDCCGERGALDFMGDFLCDKCADEIVEAAEDIGLLDEPEETSPDAGAVHD